MRKSTFIKLCGALLCSFILTACSAYVVDYGPYGVGYTTPYYYYYDHNSELGTYYVP